MALRGLRLPWPGRPLARCRTRRGRLRKPVELEPPGDRRPERFAAGAAPGIPGRAEEVLELFESTRSTLPSLDRASGVGSWNSMFGFVEALYLCGSHEEAAALSTLVEGVLALVKLDHLRRPARGDPCRYRRRGGSSVGGGRTLLRHRPRGRRRCPTGSSWPTCRLHARMLLDRGGTGDDARAAEMLEALAAYRDFGMPAAAEAERLRSQALA